MNAPKTILVIDDEPSVREIVRLMLERVGFQILEAENGVQALNLAETYPGEIDLSILDVGLPDMDGTELYPLIKDFRPEMIIKE